MAITIEAAVLLLDIVVFSIYVTDVLFRFGIPLNLSITYYRYERLHRNAGLLFPALMVLIFSTTIPIWIITSWKTGLVGKWCVGMPIVAGICLLVVAFTARYKRRPKLIYYHYTFAIIAAACAILWWRIVTRQIAFVALRLGLFTTFMAAGVLTHTNKKCTLFWLELTAFYATFFTLFLLCFLPL